MDQGKPFEKTLGNLIEEILGTLDVPANEVKRSKAFLPGISKSSGGSELQKSSIEDLRLCLKYLLFDLDATRRENMYLKKLLDKNDC